MNSAYYFENQGDITKYKQGHNFPAHQQTSNHIEPCITIRPTKQHQYLNTSVQKIKSSQTNRGQSLNLTIPKNSQSDMLWKTQMSQSFVEKLEIFEDEEAFMAENMKNDLLIKLNLESRMSLVKRQVVSMKEFVNEVKEKVLQMHRVYSEGNRKSIELVMLIVRQLQKQNSMLKQKLSSMNSLHLSQSFRPIESRNCMIQTEFISNDQKNQTKPIYEAESMQETRIQPTDKASEKQPSPLDQEKEYHQRIQSSPVWSVLLGEYQLETIQELEHDDSTCSLHTQNIHSFNDGTHTFSSKMDVTDRISMFHQSQVQFFNFQEVTNLFSQNHQKDSYKENESKSHSKTKTADQVKDQLVSKVSQSENPSSEINLEEDEEQSLIVKKLLKLNKIGHRKNNPSLTSLTTSSSGQNFSTFHNLKPVMNEIFAGISISTLSPKQNPHSISQALTILKQYNQNNAVNSQVLKQSQKHNTRQLKVKGPGKISICANKRVQNKENIPDSDQI